MLNRKIIVVGGSAAGPAAAAKAKRVNPNHEVILYEASEYISVGTCEIPYVLSRKIENYENILFFSPESFEAEKKVKVRNFHRVESIDKIKKKILVRDLKKNFQFEETYDKLILCTGSTKRSHPEFPKGLKNVFYLKTVDDMLEIQKFIQSYEISNSMIIGAGFTGLEALDFVKKYSKNIFLVDRNLSPLDGFSEEVQKIILDEIQSDNCEFIGGAANLTPKIKNEKVEAVTINGQTYPTDLILITIGFEPNSNLAQSANLAHHMDSTIRVDKKLQTSDDNIYAAGDCISVENFITKRPMWLPLATLSYNFGHIAGANAAGESIYAQPVVKNIIFKVGCLSVAHVGLNHAEIKAAGFEFREVSSIGNSRISIMPDGEKHFIKVFFDYNNQKIFGAEMIGGEDLVGKANLISFAIKNHISIDKLHLNDYAYTPTLSPFIETLSIIGKKSKD
ncbi:MAG: FAD-dependent oxidoreductase [Bacteroidetes bacterium]|nr:FAD-dependent oxidoreductase [Bacteroidota bacterium]